VVLPVNAPFAIRQPVLAAPAIAVELDNFLDEVPGPGERAVGLNRVELGAERGEVDAVLARGGSGEDRLLAIDLADDGAVIAIQDVVVAGRRANVEVFTDDRRGRDVACVSRAAASLERPQDFQNCAWRGYPEPSMR
jgi:hypothetical protein